jgi:hypothetical protein
VHKYENKTSNKKGIIFIVRIVINPIVNICGVLYIRIVNVKQNIGVYDGYIKNKRELVSAKRKN